jgi:hypothetical protein
VALVLSADADNEAAIDIAPHETNGYPLFGAAFALALLPGNKLFASITGAVIGATSKVITLDGTATDKITIMIGFGLLEAPE